VQQESFGWLNARRSRKAGAGDCQETARVSGLALDVAEAIPPIRVTDGVPHAAVVGDPAHLELAVDFRAADGVERAGMVCLLYT
jgi:hypothetical protein